MGIVFVLASLLDVRTPGLDGDLPASVAPGEVAVDGLLLLLVVAIVRIVQGKLPQRRELALDAVEPGGVGGHEVQFDLMRLGPLKTSSLRCVE